MEAGLGEQGCACVGSPLAGEVAEGAAGLFDDRDHCGNVPGPGAQQEEGVELSCRDQEGSVASTGSGGRFAGWRREVVWR